MVLPCGGRFNQVEGGGLPAVTDYAYSGNLATRGINDRGFTFGEVCSESTWLFEERTVNGNLDVFTGATGEFVTRSEAVGGPEFTGNYSGWTAFGDHTHHIPATGRTFTTGEFPLDSYNTFFVRSMWDESVSL